MSPKEFLFAAIKSQFPWADSPLSCQGELSRELILSAYELGAKQDLGHLVASAAEGFAWSDLKKEFHKQKMIAVFRRVQISFEEKKIFALFDENQIDYIPLKGSVVKNFYPEAWMRTSSDSDILIRPEDSEKAMKLLTEQADYRYEGKSLKDFQFYSQSGVHMELHFSAECQNEKLDRVLSRIWEQAVRREGSNRHDLSPEFLMFHTVAHALYHFLGGGCGIKPFLDIWVLNNRMKYDKEKLESFLEESQSEKFYEAFLRLSEVWFKGKEHTELTEKMENYIFEGGVYGNRENLGKASIHRDGGRFKYLLRRIFKPRKALEAQYPSLEKRPYLLPFYQIKRWFNLLDKERRSDVNQELQGGLKRDETLTLFEQLGI